MFWPLKDPCHDPLLCKWGRVEVLGRKELPGHLAQTFRGEPKREQSPLSPLGIAALQREVAQASRPTDKRTDRQTAFCKARRKEAWGQWQLELFCVPQSSKVGSRVSEA